MKLAITIFTCICLASLSIVVVIFLIETIFDIVERHRIDKEFKEEEKQAIKENASDKYRWHDLRKNPDDLPKDGVYCVAVPDDYGTIWLALARYRNKLNITGNKIGWGFRGDVYKMDFDTMKVIAWKHIEPFEEDAN